MHKKVFNIIRYKCILFLIPLLVSLIAGCTGNKAQKETVCEEIVKTTIAKRTAVGDDEAFDICSDVATGIVSSVELIQNDYYPIYVNYLHDLWLSSSVPLEQWALTHYVITVRIEETLSGTIFRDIENATFNIPLAFRQVSFWDETNLQYTGHTFAIHETEPNVCRLGDRVTLIRGGGAFTGLMGDSMSFVFCEGRRLEIGWLFCGQTKPEWPKDTFQRSIPDYSKNTTILETAFYDPKKKNVNISHQEAENQHDYAVQGFVKSSIYREEQFKIYIQETFPGIVLEEWEVKGWKVLVTIEKVLKEGDTTIGNEAEILFFLPEELVNDSSGTSIRVRMNKPEEGTSILAYWDEQSDGAQTKWELYHENSNYPALYAFVNRNP